MGSNVANFPMLSSLTLWQKDAQDLDFGIMLYTKDAKEHPSSLVAWLLKERENIDPMKDCVGCLMEVPKL